MITGAERERQRCDTVRTFDDAARAQAVVTVHERLTCTPSDCPRLLAALKELTGDQRS